VEQIPAMQGILAYLIDTGLAPCDDDEPQKLPAMQELADEMGVSRGKAREALIAAQAYGIVEMRPGAGTYVRPFDFYQAIRPAVLYAIACDRENFEHFRKLRAYLEVTFWDEAVRALDAEDVARLDAVVTRAEAKLSGSPIQIPHAEHRQLHMRIFSKLENPFVQGILRAYWDTYDVIEMNLFYQLSHYQAMWASHREMVDALQAGRPVDGKAVLREHFTILEQQLRAPEPEPQQV
jgi:DNA-binding FadR family transcriptional regulator